MIVVGCKVECGYRVGSAGIENKFSVFILLTLYSRKLETSGQSFHNNVNNTRAEPAYHRAWVIIRVFN